MSPPCSFFLLPACPELVEGLPPLPVVQALSPYAKFLDFGLSLFYYVTYDINNSVPNFFEIFRRLSILSGKKDDDPDHRPVSASY
jgi:hypothetical protein